MTFDDMISCNGIATYPIRLAEYEFSHGHFGILGADRIYKFNFERAIFALYVRLTWTVIGAFLGKRYHSYTCHCQKLVDYITVHGGG